MTVQSNTILRKYIDILNEGPPAGVGPNAPVKPAATAQQPDQDMFTKMLPSMGNKVIDQMAGLTPQLQKVLQDFTPGSPYYEKNVKGNPKLEKAAADTLAQAGQFAQDPNALGNYIADIKQRFNQALTTTKGASGTSPEYNKAADELGLPAVKETQNPQIKVPPIPALPKTDGELPGGEFAKTNTDGTRSYSGAFGTFTYDKSGKAIRYDTPNFGGLAQSKDLTSGDQTTSVNQGPVSVTQTTAPGGYVKQSDSEYDMGTATASQQIKNPTVGSNQLAGTTTNTVTDKVTGQTKQQVQGVAFGGASGKNVGKNYVGSSKDDLAQHAANSITGGQPPATTVKEGSNLNRSLLEHIQEIENEGPLTSGDYFHIELAEDEGIETWVIAEWSESVLIEADSATLKLLEEHGCTFYDELSEAEYQGRSVPLGKPMSGDVKKSKVYVKKPNGKVVKVNFGDKKMTIKKSNPKRRKSFRARHNCQNPGPRWKARYWSCRAW